MRGRRLSQSLRWVVMVLLFTLAVPVPGAAQSSLDLVVNYVEGTPSETAVAFDVQTYVSVVDGDGDPLKDLTAEHFTVSEDSQQVEIGSVDLVDDQPIHVVLVLDTSGSMVGQAMTFARQAANSFVEDLAEEDSVAVISFNHEVTTETDFTTDHPAVQERINLINAIPNAGTCLYDAAWQAVEMTASLPAGRRAIILLTDGVDEYNSQPCSAMTADDVIDAGSSGGTRVPVYTVGLGARVDGQGLERMATLTGGRYLYSPSPADLEDLFLQISDQLRSQYVITYTSLAAPGAHTLVVRVDYEGNQDQDTRSFLLPALPTRVSFRGLAEGDEVYGLRTVTVVVSGQGEPVSQVLLQVDGETVASDSTTPYEMEVDFSQFAEGDLALVAVVQGADESELGTARLNLVISADAPGVGEPAEGETGAEEGLSTQTLVIAGAIVVGLGLVGLVLFLLGGRKKKRSERQRDQAWERAQTLEEFSAPKPAADRTMDDWEPAPDTLGVLVVEASDDASMIGHRFEITRTPTSLGRSAGTDITFPKDSPVSRQHAEIVQKGNALYVSEIQSPDENGQLRPPKFGTLVDEVPLGGGQALLKNGSVLQLGKRVRLRYQAPARLAGSEEKTMDDFNAGETVADLPPGGDPDTTMEQ
ncbi:MAG: VWA domain-containing protein [Anaerolineales bacterium]|nr:VWA domain-containing protein [Anaerolineales bacterium]